MSGTAGLQDLPLGALSHIASRLDNKNLKAAGRAAPPASRRNPGSGLANLAAAAGRELANRSQRRAALTTAVAGARRANIREFVGRIRRVMHVVEEAIAGRQRAEDMVARTSPAHPRALPGGLPAAVTQWVVELEARPGLRQFVYMTPQQRSRGRARIVFYWMYHHDDGRGWSRPLASSCMLSYDGTAWSIDEPWRRSWPGRQDSDMPPIAQRIIRAAAAAAIG